MGTELNVSGQALACLTEKLIDQGGMLGLMDALAAVMINPQPEPPGYPGKLGKPEPWRMAAALQLLTQGASDVAKPDPVPWRVALDIRLAIDSVLQLCFDAGMTSGTDKPQGVVDQAGAIINQKVNKLCSAGTGGRNWPRHWPVPMLGKPGATLTGGDALLVAATQLHNAAQFDTPLCAVFERAAERLLREGLSRLEKGKDAGG